MADGFIIDKISELGGTRGAFLEGVVAVPF
jgi:hypothetical protein